MSLLPQVKQYIQNCKNAHVVLLTRPQLSAKDVSAQAPMKGAAKCDKHCELQNSVNQWNLERSVRSQEMPESMSASVSCHLCALCMPLASLECFACKEPCHTLLGLLVCWKRHNVCRELLVVCAIACLYAASCTSVVLRRASCYEFFDMKSDE